MGSRRRRHENHSPEQESDDEGGSAEPIGRHRRGTRNRKRSKEESAAPDAEAAKATEAPGSPTGAIETSCQALLRVAPNLLEAKLQELRTEVWARVRCSACLEPTWTSFMHRNEPDPKEHALCCSCFENSMARGMFNCPVCRQPGSGRDPQNRNPENEPVLKALGLHRMCNKCNTDGFHSPEGAHSLCLAEEIPCLNAPACSVVCVRRDMEQHVRECQFHRCPLCLFRGTRTDIDGHHQRDECPVAAVQKAWLQMMQTAIRTLSYCIATNVPRSTVRQSISALQEEVDHAYQQDMLAEWLHMSQQIAEISNALDHQDAPAAAAHVVHIDD
jgi:hypothetical protein